MAFWVETGRLNLSSQFDPFGLLVNAFVSVPLFIWLPVPGFMLAGGIEFIVPLFVPLPLAHGLPFALVACGAGLFELTLLAFVFAGVFVVVGAFVEFGVWSFTFVDVPVVAPFVPEPGCLLLTALFVHCVGILFVVPVVGVVVVVVVGGVVVCARAGVDKAVAMPVAQARPIILPAMFIRWFLLA